MDCTPSLGHSISSASSSEPTMSLLGSSQTSQCPSRELAKELVDRLQTRMVYAKMKIERGWAEQTLAQVEQICNFAGPASIQRINLKRKLDDADRGKNRSEMDTAAVTVTNAQPTNTNSFTTTQNADSAKFSPPRGFEQTINPPKSRTGSLSQQQAQPGPPQADTTSSGPPMTRNFSANSVPMPQTQNHFQHSPHHQQQSHPAMHPSMQPAVGTNNASQMPLSVPLAKTYDTFWADMAQTAYDAKSAQIQATMDNRRTSNASAEAGPMQPGLAHSPMFSTNQGQFGEEHAAFGIYPANMAFGQHPMPFQNFSQMPPNQQFSPNNFQYQFQPPELHHFQHQANFGLRPGFRPPSGHGHYKSQPTSMGMAYDYSQQPPHLNQRGSPPNFSNDLQGAYHVNLNTR